MLNLVWFGYSVICNHWVLSCTEVFIEEVMSDMDVVGGIWVGDISCSGNAICKENEVYTCTHTRTHTHTHTHTHTVCQNSSNDQ